MYIFGNDSNKRGCFHVVRIDTSESRGAIIELPNGTTMPEADYADALVVTGYTMQEAESASFLKCFGDSVYTYAFGHNPRGSVLKVQMVALLGGDAGGSGGAGGYVNKLLGKYSASRLYKSLKYTKFKMTGTEVMRGFLVGLSSNTINSELSLQMHTATIQLVEVQ